MRKIATPYLNLAWLAVPFLFSRCGTYSGLYQSPLPTVSQPYTVIPLKADSLKSATYVTGGITEGGANEDLSDNLFALSGSFYRSHSFGHFQGFYGASASIGSYDVRRHRYVTWNAVNNSVINAAAGGKFFGGYGAQGGIDFVHPIFRGSEWRVLGLSFSLQNEFGNYRRFRKALPDSAAGTIFHNSLIGVLGLSTEFAFKVRHGMLGYKLILARDILNGRSQYKGIAVKDKTEDSQVTDMAYFGQVLSLTRDRVTGSFQFNASYYTINARLGFSYRLGQRRRSSKIYKP
jgi:hypothetical protein